MQTSQIFKSGSGQAIALHILAVPDFALGIAGLAIALVAGWPGDIANTTDNTMWLGFMFFVVMAQLPLRLPMFALIMRWTWRLVSNAERQGRFPVSSRWAWVGYIVPVVAFWMPARAIWSLNARHTPMPGWQAVLVIAWWLSRLLTCATGVVLIFLFLAIEAGIRTRGLMNDTDGIVYGFQWLATVFIIGVVTRLLEAAVITLTHRRQPKPGEVAAATVF